MSRDTYVNNKIPKNLRTLLDEWTQEHRDSISDALTGGILLYMSVDNLLRSAALSVGSQLEREEMTLDEAFEALIAAREEAQRKHDRAADLTGRPPPKMGGHRKASG